MINSLYIHIPFCNRICTYCDFTKVLIDNQPVDDYIDALIIEMDRVNQSTFQTIFVGGGTPTALSESQLIRVLTAINARFDCMVEFTFEANPDELTPVKIDILRRFGVNRLSLGVQSFNDTILHILGRTHTNRNIYDTIRYLQSINFNNYSIDLMYNLPTETLSDIDNSLKAIQELHPVHISWYSLIVEPHTVFYNMACAGKLHIKNKIDEGEIYTRVMNGLEELGFKQYEISNFSKAGYESIHNSTYWENNEYYGLGAGSHGYVDGVRYTNVKPINHYIKGMKSDGLATLHEHHVTVTEKMEEEMFLGLRLNRGVGVDNFHKKFNTPLETVYGNVIDELINRQWIKLQNGRIMLTDVGRMIGNDVFSRFLKD